MHVVGEETLLVQHNAEALGTGFDRHGLAVLVTIQLDDCVEALAQGVTVSGETDDGEEKGGVGLRSVSAADLENLWDVAGVDGITRCRASITGEDGEGVAGDGEGGAAVVGVSEMRLARVFLEI